MTRAVVIDGGLAGVGSAQELGKAGISTTLHLVERLAG